MLTEYDTIQLDLDLFCGLWMNGHHTGHFIFLQEYQALFRKVNFPKKRASSVCLNEDSKQICLIYSYQWKTSKCPNWLVVKLTETDIVFALKCLLKLKQGSQLAIAFYYLYQQSHANNGNVSGGENIQEACSCRFLGRVTMVTPSRAQLRYFLRCMCLTGY